MATARHAVGNVGYHCPGPSACRYARTFEFEQTRGKRARLVPNPPCERSAVSPKRVRTFEGGLSHRAENEAVTKNPEMRQPMSPRITLNHRKNLFAHHIPLVHVDRSLTYLLLLFLLFNKHCCTLFYIFTSFVNLAEITF